MARDRQQINNYLGGFGLSTLDDPRGLINQLGFLVRDDKHFGQLLIKCPPEQRRAMYDSLKPHLRFEARDLESYIIAGKQMAENEQLPTLGEDGQLHPFQPYEVQSEGVDTAVGAALAKYHLTLTCRKCTREETFDGWRRADAVQAAREAGWAYSELNDKGSEICPACPGTRPKGLSIPGVEETIALVREFKEQANVTEYMFRHMEPGAEMTPQAWDAVALKAARAWARDGKPAKQSN